MKSTFLKALLIAALGVVGVKAAYAYVVPEDNSNVPYFYVFGPEGDSKMGAEDGALELFVDVPANGGSSQVEIQVFDPDTGGNVDWREGFSNDWNTSTSFSVYGGSNLLASETFGKDSYNYKYFKFGPFNKTQGEKVGNVYRFKLVAQTTSGDDANLFRVKVLPEEAQAYSYNVTFRLARKTGSKMYFFPEVGNGTKNLIIENYDLDVNGGTSTIFDVAAGKQYKVNDSTSGQWAETNISTDLYGNSRFEYVIKKTQQIFAHAGLRFKNEAGEYLPIYFRKGKSLAYTTQKGGMKYVAPMPMKKAAPKMMSKPVVPASKCSTFTFDGRGSYDKENQNLEYLWDFGDGNTSTDPMVSHTYAKGGKYNVKLSVTDNSGLQCDTAVTNQSVEVNTPPSAAFSSQEMVCTNQEVFLDAGRTTDNTPSSLTYAWNFGDGTSAEGTKASKTYTKGGTYKVGLTVDDNSNSECSLDSTERYIKVNTPPVAEAGNDVDLCLKNQDDPYEVYFNGAGSSDADNDDLVYTWDFGDGQTGSGSKAAHTYRKGGVYTAKLTVSDGSKSQCSVAQDAVKVDISRAPIASAGNDKSVCLGDSIGFDGSKSSAEGQSLAYAWNFGDGETATGVKPTHKYSKGGRYLVSLNVNNGKENACSEGVDSLYVDVNARPMVNLQDVSEVCLGDTVGLDASDSKDPDGDSLNYNWDFGDGKTVEGGSKMSHKYAKTGTYKAKVTASDGNQQCGVSQDMTTVVVSQSPVANAGSANGSKDICLGDSVTFDGSKSTGGAGDKLAYNWSFGDGESATGARATHKYAKGGRYLATLRVNNGRQTACSESVDSMNVNVNARPTVSLEDVGNSCVGDTVKLVANAADADGDSVKLTWDFGDGTVAEGGSKMSHKYAKGGTYKVTVTADDKNGSGCSKSTDTTYVKVNTPPKASSGPNLACCVDQTTAFDGSSSMDPDGDKLSYTWTFGDGDEANGAKASHVYKESGNYKVYLKVDDNSGSSCSTDVSGFDATVNTKPVPVIKIK